VEAASEHGLEPVGQAAVSERSAGALAGAQALVGGLGGVPGNADLVFVAERGRDLLLPAHATPAPARRVRSIVDLQAAINRFIEDHNAAPKPFVWTADPDTILDKVTRGTQALASLTRSAPSAEGSGG
jgi:hypothetical protein